VLVSSLISSVLALSVLAAPSHSADPDPAVPLDDRGTAAATDALAEVQGLLDGITSFLPGVAAPDADLTMALRDLALLKNELPPSLRSAAESYLARPTDGDADEFGNGYAVAEETPVCSAVVCVHYVTSSPDRVDTTDGNGNGVPDYVDFALKTMTDVHNTYVAAGYRAPKSDLAADNNGGNALPDVYLANIGVDGFYGYCATDQDVPANQPQDTWGYCVLDNDYSRGEFPTNTSRENLQVTAAHEYFHDVQFGYDVSEDGWIMEATATWAEDELYAGVNDNVQYLRGGPMGQPRRPLDQFAGTFHYGTWIFFRHLTERFRNSQGGMPILVRDLWRRLDDAPGGIGEYSLKGLKRVLNQRGLPLSSAFARFSAANRMPARSYDEGKRYPTAPLVSTTRLSPSRKSVGVQRVALDHMAAGTLRYTPGNKLRKDWRLRLEIDMAPTWKGTAAYMTLKPRKGAPVTRELRINRQGDVNKTYRFFSRSVKYVELTLANASDDFRCNRGTRFSCEGKPKFDDLIQRIKANVYRAP